MADMVKLRWLPAPTSGLSRRDRRGLRLRGIHTRPARSEGTAARCSHRCRRGGRRTGDRRAQPRCARTRELGGHRPAAAPSRGGGVIEDRRSRGRRAATAQGGADPRDRRRAARRHRDRGPQQHRGDALGGGSAEQPPRDLRRRPTCRPRAAACRHATRAAWRPGAQDAELDRRQRLQPVLRRLRAASARTRRGPARGPVRVLQRRRRPCGRPGSDRARAVRDDPPVRRRQRPNGPRADPRDPAPARARPHLRAADLARPRDPGRRLRRRPHPHALRRSARRPGRARGTQRLDRVLRRRLPTRRRRRRSNTSSRSQNSSRRGERGSAASVRDSATDLLLDALPGAPVLTVQSAAALTGRSVQAVNEAVARLSEARVLTQTTIGKRNRAFEAPELIDAFTALERQLASPEADTRTSPPARPVPRERRR